MQHRVRAVLLTPAGTMLLMRRIRPGREPYSVIVGGKVEPTDAGPEAAVLREVREEIAGEATVVRLFHTLETDGERQDFYLATVERWNFEARTGPEFSQEGRGEYLLQEIPLTAEAIDGVNLLPPEIAGVLRDAAEKGTPLASASLRGGHRRQQPGPDGLADGWANRSARPTS